MLIDAYSSRHVPEKYSDYRNRVFDRHIKKLKDSLMQIRQCSLKPDDKEKLKKQLSELLNQK